MRISDWSSDVCSSDLTTAVSCCGANPGMVSWFVKAALLNIAGDTGVDPGAPASREDCARIMQRLGVQGIHIAARDTQPAREPRPMIQFWNTWSVEGFLAKVLQHA